jgi:GNAT superfamily N-acetyltransferase
VDHELGDFQCGEERLDSWLRDHAQASQRADIARTYVVFEGESVVAYVSLMTGSIRPESAPKRYSRGMPCHSLPTIVVARLAVDRRHQGNRIGSRLLAEALRRAVRTSDVVAARLVVVDAIDDRAAAFYRRWGFIDVAESPRRLSRKIGDIRRSLENNPAG